MAVNSFTATQGTQTSILTDNTGGTAGTVIPVMKLSMDGQGTYTDANLFQGTIPQVNNIGTINTATVTTGSIVVTAGTVVNNGGSAIAYGPSAAAAAATGNPLNVGGTDSGGTIRTIKVDSGGLQRIGIDSGTISVLPNLPQGSINVTAGTVNAGTINTGTINLGSIGGLAANAAAMSGNPVAVGGTDSGGTIRTIKVDSGGLQRIGIDSGTISVLPNLPQGSINVTAGTIGTVTGAGTLTNLGSVTNVGQIYNAGTLQTGANTIGNIGTLITGTLLSSGTTTGVGTMTNLGSVTNVGQVYNAGTLQAGTINSATISAGTVHLAGTVQDSFSGLGTFTITIGTLASSGSVGRQSQIVDNTSNLWPAALIAVKTTAGTVTAAGAINIYLYRSDNGGGPIQDDLTGTADAAATVNNSPLLGVIPINIGTNNQYQAIFDTTFLGHLGPKFGIIVQHALGNPLNATSGSHSITYQSIASKFS